VEGKVMRGFEGLDVGDQVRVELIGTDVERGFIDFARTGWDRDIENHFRKMSKGLKLF
jgi:exoribonuclease-2